MTALADGFYAVPPGKIATIVTDLEMHAPFDMGDASLPPGVTLRRMDADVDAYRALHRRIGEEWLWSDRLELPKSALADVLNDPAVELFTLTKDGQDEGLLELDFRARQRCELAYFGLTRALIGTGSGRALMREAITRAWAKPIDLFWVHTCTLDSPQALGFYRSCGFKAVARRVEIADDPRLTDALPRDAAPQVPVIES